MSRHEIEAKNSNHTCTVGYDRGMKTFFAQVEDNEIARQAEEAAERVAIAYDEERTPDPEDVKASSRDSIVYWIGAGRTHEVPDVEKLAKMLERYAELTEEMKETLRADQEQEESTPRTQHEINMLAFIQSQTKHGVR